MTCWLPKKWAQGNPTGVRRYLSECLAIGKVCTYIYIGLLLLVLFFSCPNYIDVGGESVMIFRTLFS